MFQYFIPTNIKSLHCDIIPKYYPSPSPAYALFGLNKCRFVITYHVYKDPAIFMDFLDLNIWTN